MPMKREGCALSHLDFAAVIPTLTGIQCGHLVFHLRVNEELPHFEF
jgi:hypothetical protein